MFKTCRCHIIPLSIPNLIITFREAFYIVITKYLFFCQCLHVIRDGERYEMAPTSFEHGDIEIKLGEFLRRHIKEKGYVAVGEVGVLISKKPFTIRAADVVYISKEKSPERPKGILEIPPDLIIEIISETNTAWEIT